MPLDDDIIEVTDDQAVELLKRDRVIRERREEQKKSGDKPKGPSAHLDVLLFAVMGRGGNQNQ